MHSDKIHSWTADIANALHPDYVWHAFAKIWQTASDGGAFFREQNATPREDRAARYEALGLSHDDALTLASWSDEVMGRCILDLYPSATPNPYSHWRDAWGPTSTPGLIIFPSQDSFGDETMSREVAQQLGAGHETLDDAGHFWPRQAPQAGATILVDFFNLLD